MLWWLIVVCCGETAAYGKRKQEGLKLKKRHSSFPIPHSPFLIPNSSFPTSVYRRNPSSRVRARLCVGFYLFFVFFFFRGCRGIFFFFCFFSLFLSHRLSHFLSHRLSKLLSQQWCGWRWCSVISVWILVCYVVAKNGVRCHIFCRIFCHSHCHFCCHSHCESWTIIVYPYLRLMWYSCCVAKILSF